MEKLKVSKLDEIFRDSGMYWSRNSSMIVWARSTATWCKRQGSSCGIGGMTSGGNLPRLRISIVCDFFSSLLFSSLLFPFFPFSLPDRPPRTIRKSSCLSFICLCLFALCLLAGLYIASITLHLLHNTRLSRQQVPGRQEPSCAVKLLFASAPPLQTTRVALHASTRLPPRVTQPSCCLIQTQSSALMPPPKPQAFSY